MTENNVAFPQGDKAGQAFATEDGNQPKPVPLTRDELSAILDARDEKVRREQQKVLAKQHNMVERARKQIESFKGKGVDITDEQAQVILREAANLSEPESEPEPEQKREAQPLTPQQQMVENAYRKYGVTLMETDPEAQELPKTQDFDDWYPDFLAALKKKAQRANTPPQARIPSPAMGGNTGPSEDQYISEMFAARGNRAGVEGVKEKFRKMGLDVDHINLYKR